MPDEYDYLLDFLNCQRAPADHCEDVLLVPGDFLAEQGSLTHHDTNLGWLLSLLHCAMIVLFLFSIISLIFVSYVIIDQQNDTNL